VVTFASRMPPSTNACTAIAKTVALIDYYATSLAALRVPEIHWLSLSARGAELTDRALHVLRNLRRH